MSEARWVEDTVFEHDGIVVQVNRLTLKKPKFSIKFGRRGAEPGMIVPFVGIEVLGLGKVTIKSVAPVISELLAKAEEYIASEAQIAEDMYIGNRQDKELSQISKGQPKAVTGLSGGRSSGKTQREREKKMNRGKEA